MNAIRRVAVCVSTAVAIGSAALLAPAAAHADPSATDWLRLRQCESSNNYSINTGNGYYGAYQFNLSTWQSVGGSGLPSSASAGEQDARALILYRERGWQPWTCATILGLKEDADARSGRISDIKVPVTPPTSTVPAYTGGTRGWKYGDNNSSIKAFQNEVHARGYFPAGTGQFGPLTLAMVKRMQSLNHLTVTGVIDAKTWPMAWKGVYSLPATAPPFPSTTPYVYGNNNANIKKFQDQMHSRSSFPAGTGQFGPLTLAMVKRLQSENGLTQTGQIDAKTWAMAWNGRYIDP